MNTPTETKPLIPLSQERDRELLKDAQSYIYQSGSGYQLAAHCFLPPNHEPSDLQAGHRLLPRRALGRQHGCLSSHLMECISPAGAWWPSLLNTGFAQLMNRLPRTAVEDAQMAMLWLKNNHRALGVDPSRIIAAGAASGAHMALSLAMMNDVFEIDGYSPRPLGVIALSAIVDTTKKGIGFERFANPRNATEPEPLQTHQKRPVPDASGSWQS